MARKKTKRTTKTTDFRHRSAKRTNIPPAKIAGEGTVPDAGMKKYAYSPHLSPVLGFDPEARSDKVRDVVEKAVSGKGLNEAEREILRAVGANWESPWLEWANKQEEHDRHWRTVDPVALHIHERVSANAILSTAKRKDVERDLFADPELEYQKAVQFYKHEMDWANRLILGDSLEVMTSLGNRERLAGKVQMIYIDPPYGIKFGSNFQPEIKNRNVDDKDTSLTREPEMVRAYRDTWNLGTHSYLSYLRDRLLVARTLLTRTGSIFVQISDENVHRVRQIMDEVFGPANFQSLIAFSKAGGGLRAGTRLSSRNDYIVWYARDGEEMYFRQLFESAPVSDPASVGWIEEPSGVRRRPSQGEKEGVVSIPPGSRLFGDESLDKPGPGSKYEIEAFGRKLTSGSRWWGAPKESLQQLIDADRVFIVGNTLRYIRYTDESAGRAHDNIWVGIGGQSNPTYAVQTNSEIVKRCMLMSTKPGELVLDPTCGSGTTAYVAEEWGRRWITIDSSRVAVSIARQRLLTSKFSMWRLSHEFGGSQASESGSGSDPSVDFSYQSCPRVTTSSIGNNENLGPIIERHAGSLDQALGRVNRAAADITSEARVGLVEKLATKLQSDGLRSVTDADRRCWLLPGTAKEQIARAFAGKRKLKAKHVTEYANAVPPNGKFEHWHVPFDTDPQWPESLSKAVVEYREAWRAKTDEVNECIAANADQESLVDQPEVVRDVVRVSGPFTVEGVIPEELNIGEDGLFDGTPNEELDYSEIGGAGRAEPQNLHAYLHSMVAHLLSDGVTFPDNKNPQFARLEALFDSDSASAIHAEGVWEGEDADGPARVGVGFGPQYGPVTAIQVEDLIREASRRGYDELVIAGFSFDAEAHAIIQEDPNPKVRAHMAQIRPDLNAGMEGLLKDTPKSQLFTVFGTPSIDVAKNGDEYTVTLEGVDIYDPVRNVVQATGASKVAAWFLDSDFNGRTFCITQAFFPDQDAWEKLAKALKDVANPEAFAAFKGTTSLPFEAGEHRQVAVKVIDPRGNEVMTIHKLEG